MGYVLGVSFGGLGVVIAWVFSLSLGSCIVYVSYHLKFKIPLGKLLPETSRVIILACISGLFAGFILRYKLDHYFNTVTLNVFIIIAFVIIVFVPFWIHPMRKRLVQWVTEELLN
jgi:hypothetical protein